MCTNNESTPRTEAQKQASRNNGAKSHGPRTPEGRERCRIAATVHGMYTPQILLINEDPAKYHRLLTHYVAEWNPIGQDERDLVTDIVNARWRIRRNWGQTAGLVNAEMIIVKDATERAYVPVTAELRQCDAICSLEQARPGLLSRMQQQENSLKRLITRSRRELIELQTLRLGEKPTRNPQPDEDLIFLPSCNCYMTGQATNNTDTDPAANYPDPDANNPDPEASPQPDTPSAGPQEVPNPDNPLNSTEGPELDSQSVCPFPEEFHPVSYYIPSPLELRDRAIRWGKPPDKLAA